jgi:hypothetical protein
VDLNLLHWITNSSPQITSLSPLSSVEERRSKQEELKRNLGEVGGGVFIFGAKGCWVLLLVMGKVSRSRKTGVGTLGLFLLALLSLLLLVFVLLGFVAAPPSPDTQFALGAKVELKLPSQLHM